MAIPSFCSWSGGKDSALALHKAGRDGYSASVLLTMMAQEGGRSRSHGLPRKLLEKQSRSMGLDHVFGLATWAGYEGEFKRVVGGLKEQGIEAGIFGDIDLQEHLDWIRRICGECGVRRREPLWHYDRRRVVEEFLSAGFRALIVSCDKEKMGEEYLGQELSLALADRLTAMGVDAAGENGEFHTFVFDGPLFKEKVDFHITGSAEHGGYLFLTME